MADVLTLNGSLMANTTDMNSTVYHSWFEMIHPVDLTIGVIGCVMLVSTFICGLLLMYIVLRHGYGSITANVLILNWVLCCCIFGICSTVLVVHQSILHHPWPFGLPSCIVFSFLKNFCLLPKETIPAILCVFFYRQVLLNKTGQPGCLARVPTVVWVTLAIWIVIYDCMLGSFRRSNMENIYIDHNPDALFCNYDYFHASFIVGILAGAGNYLLLGLLVPLISVITIGVLTVKRTKLTNGYIDSPLNEKLKLRQLILALMGIIIVHFVLRIGLSVFEHFRSVGFGRSFLMPTAVMLALIFCHREFCYSLPFRKVSADDKECVLPPMTYSQLKDDSGMTDTGHE